MVAYSSSTKMTSCWLDQPRRTVWKGLASSFLVYESQDKKSLGKRPRFAKTLSDTSVFTSARGNVDSAFRGNRLSVPSQPPRPTSKLESFGELQVCAESGSLAFCFCNLFARVYKVRSLCSQVSNLRLKSAESRPAQ
jgi:hypothetical protein